MRWWGREGVIELKFGLTSMVPKWIRDWNFLVSNNPNDFFIYYRNFKAKVLNSAVSINSGIFAYMHYSNGSTAILEYYKTISNSASVQVNSFFNFKEKSRYSNSIFCNSSDVPNTDFSFLVSCLRDFGRGDQICNHLNWRHLLCK